MLYQFVFKFIVPVYRTTRKVKRGFREMQERMNQQMNQYNQQPQPQTINKKSSDSDYIEFEEVKD